MKWKLGMDYKGGTQYTSANKLPTPGHSGTLNQEANLRAWSGISANSIQQVGSISSGAAAPGLIWEWKRCPKKKNAKHICGAFIVYKLIYYVRVPLLSCRLIGSCKLALIVAETANSHPLPPITFSSVVNVFKNHLTFLVPSIMTAFLDSMSPTEI